MVDRARAHPTTSACVSGVPLPGTCPPHAARGGHPDTSQADGFVATPHRGLVIAAVTLKEGIQAWRGEGCCDPAAGRAAAAGAGARGCSAGCAGSSSLP